LGESAARREECPERSGILDPSPPEADQEYTHWISRLWNARKSRDNGQGDGVTKSDALSLLKGKK